MSKLTEKTWVPIGLAVSAMVSAASAWGYIAVMNFQVGLHSKNIEILTNAQADADKRWVIIQTDVAVIKAQQQNLQNMLNRKRVQEAAFWQRLEHFAMEGPKCAKNNARFDISSNYSN